MQVIWLPFSDSTQYFDVFRSKIGYTRYIFDMAGYTFFISFLFNLTYRRRTSSLPSCLWSLRIFPSLPGSRLTIFFRDASLALLQLVNQWLNFTYQVLTFPRFPLRKKEHKSYFGMNRTHDFRTSKCAVYLLDHSGDEHPINTSDQNADRSI